MTDAIALAGSAVLLVLAVYCAADDWFAHCAENALAFEALASISVWPEPRERRERLARKAAQRIPKLLRKRYIDAARARSSFARGEL